MFDIMLHISRMMHIPRNERKRQECRFPDGGDKGSRTPDLLNAIETLYQLSYIPVVKTANSIPNPRVRCKRDFDEFWIPSGAAGIAVDALDEVHRLPRLMSVDRIRRATVKRLDERGNRAAVVFDGD